MIAKKLGIAFAGIALLSFTSAVAQSDVRFSYDGRPERLFRPLSGLNKVDRMALRDAAFANMMEIQSSELAAKHASSVWARQYAAEMLEEHTSAHNELRLIAQRRGFDLPSGLPADRQAVITKLSKKRGNAFDTMYRSIQLKGHRETSAKFQRDIKQGRDQDVRGYLVKTLPAVKMHLRLAQHEKTMTGPTKMQHNQ